MKIVPKIIISVIVLILVAVVYFRPEQAGVLSGISMVATNREAHFVGNNTEAHKTAEYGSLALENKETNGYGYIRNNYNEKADFGRIEFETALSDSSKVNQLRLRFSTNDIKMYSNSGILYALINGTQLYIENKGVSEVNGFNGKIDIALVVNTKGVVDSVLYLSSEETPAYLGKLAKAEYFKQFCNLPMDGQHRIDAVSGATITSVAVAKATNEIFGHSKDKILGDYLTGNYSKFSVDAKLNKLWIVNLVILAILFFASFFKRFKTKRILIVISIVTVIWLGFYFNASFTWLLFLKPFTTTGISVFTAAYILLVLCSVVWFKNSYCKHICPFGNAQKLMYRISPFKNRQTVFKNKHLKLARYVISFFVIAGYFSGVEMLSEYELFPHFFSVNISSILFITAVLFILISMRIPNLWCRTLCPTGCMLDLVSDIAENKKL